MWLPRVIIQHGAQFPDNVFDTDSLTNGCLQASFSNACLVISDPGCPRKRAHLGKWRKRESDKLAIAEQAPPLPRLAQIGRSAPVPHSRPPRSESKRYVVPFPFDFLPT